MFEEIAKRDMRLLTYMPVNLFNEETLLSGIQYLNKQDIFSARPDPAEPGLVKHEQEQVKKVLQFIPEKFRTEKVCIAALYHSQENLKYVPDAIRHTLSFKDGKVTQTPPNVLINQHMMKIIGFDLPFFLNMLSNFL